MKENNTFQRVEKKYLMTREQYKTFIDRTKNYIQPDQYGLHTISNIYYDTDNYDLIRQSIGKPKYKEKFRVRGYGRVTEDSIVFLEIKKKYDGIVYKRRTAMYLDEAKKFLKTGITSHDDQITREIRYFFEFYKPVPKLYLAYDRVAYEGVRDRELRLTIDQRIRSRRTPLDLSRGDFGNLLTDGNTYLMEIKVPQAYPIWLADVLAELDIYPVSFSKYGTVYKQGVLNHELEFAYDAEERGERGQEESEDEGRGDDSQTAEEMIQKKDEETQLCSQAYSVV